MTKRAFVKYRKTKDEKQLEDADQTLRDVVKPKPYPNMESFKTIFKDVSDRMPAAKAADPSEFVDVSFLRELDSRDISMGCTDESLLEGPYRIVLPLDFPPLEWGSSEAMVIRTHHSNTPISLPTAPAAFSCAR
jgi:hypothetical protein